MNGIDEKLQPILAEVIRRNAGETEFHQAVHEVLESLGRVVAKHPHYLEHALIERICEPERAPGRLAADRPSVERRAGFPR